MPTFKVGFRKSLDLDLLAAKTIDQVRQTAPVTGKKEQREKVYTLKRSDIDRIRKEAIGLGVEVAWKAMIGLPLMALHDKFGFGRVRLQRYLSAVLDKYESYQKGYIELNDIDQMLWDECQLKINSPHHVTHIV